MKIQLNFRKRTATHYAAKSNFGTYLRLGKKGTSWVYDINEATLFTNKQTAKMKGLRGLRKKEWKGFVEVIKVEVKILAVESMP